MSWWLDGLGSVETWTAADGTYELGIPPGRVSILVAHDNGLHTTQVVDLALGEHRNNVNIEVASRGTSSGTLFDEHGKPSEHTSFNATSRDATDQLGSATDDAGHFTISVPLDHTYDITLRRDGTLLQPAFATVTKQTPTVTGLRLVLRGEVTVPGVVVDGTGAPVPGARIVTTQPTFRIVSGGSTSNPTWLQTEDTSRMMGRVSSSMYDSGMQTDAAGEFTWIPRLNDAHTILARTDDGRAGLVTEITKETATVKITLATTGSIAVVCDGFKPMDGALQDMAGGVGIVRGQLRINAGCGETIGDLPPGRYAVSTKAGAFRFGYADVDVTSKSVSKATLRIKPAVALHGTVVSYPDNKPLAGMECDAGMFDGNRLVRGDEDATSDAQGNFTRNVSQGRMVLTCKDPRDKYSDASTVVDDNGATTAMLRAIEIPTEAINLVINHQVTPRGIEVTNVAVSAAATGLLVGDIILAVDGHSTLGLGRHAAKVFAFTLRPHTTIRWTVMRSGKPVTLSYLPA